MPKRTRNGIFFIMYHNEQRELEPVPLGNANQNIDNIDDENLGAQVNQNAPIRKRFCPNNRH